MPSNKVRLQDVRKAVLVIDKSTYKNELMNRIEKGKEILSIYEPCQVGGVSLGGYHSMLPEGQRLFVSEFKKWTEYNLEYLKQAFDIPNNEYYTRYMNYGQSLVLTSEINTGEIIKDELEEKIELLETYIETADLLPCNIVDNKNSIDPFNRKGTKRVFVVHGHDMRVRTEVELLVKQLNLEPVVLFKEPNKGDTIIEKIEREASDVAFAIVIYTPCDLGGEKGQVGDMEKLKPRARQNVVFEHGYMCAKLGRNRVCALYDDEIEFPGDLSGIIYILHDENGIWRYTIAKEMKASSLDIDMNLIK